MSHLLESCLGFILTSEVSCLAAVEVSLSVFGVQTRTTAECGNKTGTQVKRVRLRGA